MREVRIFEMEHDEPAAAWRVARPSIFKVISGEIWLTVEGEAWGSLAGNRAIDRVAARCGGVGQRRAGRCAFRAG